VVGLTPSHVHTFTRSHANTLCNGTSVFCEYTQPRLHIPSTCSSACHAHTLRCPCTDDTRRAASDAHRACCPHSGTLHTLTAVRRACKHGSESQNATPQWSTGAVWCDNRSHMQTSRSERPRDTTLLLAPGLLAGTLLRAILVLAARQLTVATFLISVPPDFSSA
jgi:hypothetical protein